MNKYQSIRKYLTVGIILLLIGIIIAPNINANVFKEYQDNNLMKVTIQVCRIKGIQTTTVTLTKQQYTEVEKIFNNLQLKLTTVNTKQEAMSLYNTALRELNSFGLLPKGMSIEQPRILIADGYSTEQRLQIVEKSSYHHNIQENQNNSCCLVAGVVQDGYAMGLMGNIGMILQIIAIMTHMAFFALMGNILLGLSEIIINLSPVELMQGITLFEADFYSVGLSGFKHHTLPYNSGTGKIFGYNGIKLTNILTGEIRLLGFAVAVIDLSNDQIMYRLNQNK